ncbi:MAG: DNA translocase FtsK 4TM domain-containing protein, partial [Actinomycetota bacterium]
MAQKKRNVKPRAKKAKRSFSWSLEFKHPELWGLGLVALGLFLGSVVYAGWNGGYVGGALADGFHAILGAATYLLPAAFVGIGGLMVVRSALVDFRPFRTGIILVVCGLMLALGRDQGGYFGQMLGGAVGVAIGATGSTILGILLLVVGALLLSGASLGALLRSTGHQLHARVRKPSRRPAKAAKAAPQLETWDDPIVSESPAPVLPKPKPVDAEILLAPSPLVHAEPEPLVVPQAEQEPLFEDVTSEHAEYSLPDRSVLHVSPERNDDSSETSARVAELLVQTLSHFGVEAHVVGQISGPRVTRYELQLAPGTKVAKVAALKDDLSYALATTEIRILAPIPGKQAVGVELPNLSPNLVTLGDIYDDLPATASPLSVWIGKDISGAAVWTDLARMPHLLIAGTTGAGKSGCINTLLTSILLRATPDEARMILIDPKRIELNHYESVPHLLTPVVSSPKEASAVLANCVAEMERRYERLATVRARNLNEANRAFRQRGEPTLPYVLVVIDELADLMMVAPQAVEDAVIRLAQKSRAVG